MFSGIKALWGDAKITSNIDLFVSNYERRDFLEVQRCFFSFKKKCAKLAISEGNSIEVIEERIMQQSSTISEYKKRKYKEYLALAIEQGILDDVLNWIDNHTIDELAKA